MDTAHLFERASGRLPSVPKVVQELISSFQDTAVSIDSIIDKVAQDQVLSARVLRLANTARFGGLGRVGSLDEAVVLLGFDNLRMLVIASGITGAAVRMPHFDMPAFWQHSLGRANAAKGLARLAGLDPQLGYTCGLLAQIGELVLHAALPVEASHVDRLVAGGSDRLSVERLTLGIDLTEVGAELARRWNFPPLLQEAIRHQHDPLEAGEATPYAALFSLASFLVAGFGVEMSESEMLETLPQAVVQRLGLDPARLAEAMPALRAACTVQHELV